MHKCKNNQVVYLDIKILCYRGDVVKDAGGLLLATAI